VQSRRPGSLAQAPAHGFWPGTAVCDNFAQPDGLPVWFYRPARCLMLPVMAEEPDDQALMLRYRAGDTVAFERLYERHKGPLFRYCLRQCGDRELAGDLFQEVWTRIINARRRYEPSARFSTYMYQIAHNCFVDQLRRQSRRPLASDAFDPQALPAARADGAEQGAMNQQTADALLAAVAALPAEQREVFLLREEAGLSLAEIATVTGVAQETAKSRLRYALSKLRETLLARGAWP
jgi:RNA polymerase sigma-70 factor (ECF subfamily)